jgi:transposase
VDAEYAGKRYVGIDLHRRRSVIVQMTPEGERLGAAVRIDNDPFTLAEQVASWGESPEVVLEATYGWYWAADVLAEAGATVHLAHPLGVKGFAYRRVKNDLLTELTDRSFVWCVRRTAVLVGFRPRDQRRGCAAGVVRAGGAEARFA